MNVSNKESLWKGIFLEVLEGLRQQIKEIEHSTTHKRRQTLPPLGQKVEGKETVLEAPGEQESMEEAKWWMFSLQRDSLLKKQNQVERDQGEGTIPSFL